MKKRFMVTTPIYYINDKPHIGHTYCTVAADILARWHRLCGQEVLFTTGVDENASKTVEAAAKVGKDVQVYTDEMAQIWQETWDKVGIAYDTFIRTTSLEHIETVNAFWAKVQDHGDIYKGMYEGWYCTGCEAYVKESDLVDGLCPYHKTKPKRLSEENYFFNLPNFRDPLLANMDRNHSFVAPKARFNEVKNYIEAHLDPLSISRVANDWGIPVPDDDSQTIYVWFDALLNYLTAIGFGRNEDLYSQWWSKDTEILHLVGKDIIKFHCAIWPAMLLSADVHLPDHVFAHGFFTINGEKISKSLGNAIDPFDLAEKYGFDAVRYFLFREIPFGEDGDFSIERLEKRYKDDLANDLGNLLNRVLAMLEKYFDGVVPLVDGADSSIKQTAARTWQELEQSLQNIAFDKALDAIWSFLTLLNQYIEQEKPWVLFKADKDKLAGVMFNLIEGLRQASWMLAVFLPESAQKIASQLGSQQLDLHQSLEPGFLSHMQAWGAGTVDLKPQKGNPLFPPLD